MERTVFDLMSNCDGLSLSCLMTVPEENPKAIVQFSHGMAEHKERYEYVMDSLTKLGYVCVINDHRGHGKSVNDDSNLGFFSDDTAQFIVEDLHQVTRYVKGLYPDLPVILFGHSMGSLVVRSYIKKYDSDIDKLIVCGSPSKNAAIDIAILLSKISGALCGKHHRSKLIQCLAFGSYLKNIENPVSKTAWICTDNDVVKKYDDDEKCGFVFTANGFLNLFKLMKSVYDKRDWVLKNKSLPIFFIAGKDDPVIVSEKAWHDSMAFLRDMGYTNVSGKIYENSRHEILNEPCKDQVIADCVEFIEK